MTKLKKSKIIFWIFITWICFLWLGWWYIAPSCQNAWLQSTYPSPGCTNYNNGGSRYCNNWNWLSLYEWGHPWSTTKEQTQRNSLVQYMNFYNSGKDDSQKIWNPTYNSTWWIRNLQKLMGVNTDCKLWNNTINTFLTTDFCKKINSNWMVLSWSTCNEWYVLEWNACCKPNECEKPVVSWSCDSYGSGYNLEWTCCVFDCSQWKNCSSGKVRSTGSCKCVCDPNQWCCGVQLNLSMPFIWDCIEMTSSNDVNSSDRDWVITVNQLNAFPYLIQGISKILVTLILIFSIIVVIVAWLMMTTSVANEWNYKKWTDLLKKVIISLILLWTSWLILKLINPSFFGW